MGMTNLRTAALLLDALLAVAPAGQRIKGNVTTGSHLPVANSRISVVENSRIVAFSGADGSYALEGLDPGRYTILATNPRYWPNSKADIDAGQTVDFQLVERHYFKNNSRFAVDLPLIVADLPLKDASEVLKSAKMAGDTQAEYLIVNRLLAAQWGDESLKQRSNALAQLLDTQRTEIQGLVSDSHGTRLANADVKLTNEMTGAVFHTKTNDRGQYQLSVFPVGDYRIAAETGNQSISTKIEDPVSPNAKFTHDIHLGATASPK